MYTYHYNSSKESCNFGYYHFPIFLIIFSTFFYLLPFLPSLLHFPFYSYPLYHSLQCTPGLKGPRLNFQPLVPNINYFPFPLTFLSSLNVIFTITDGHFLLTVSLQVSATSMSFIYSCQSIPMIFLS